MKRATVTIPDDLEAELEEYRRSLEASPSLTALVQAALRRFLAEQRRRKGGSAAPGLPSRAIDVVDRLAGRRRLQAARLDLMSLGLPPELETETSISAALEAQREEG